MSERRKRTVYSPEFKAKVGLDAVQGVKTINEIGQAYKVHLEEGDPGTGSELVRDKAGSKADS